MSLQKKAKTYGEPYLYKKLLQIGPLNSSAKHKKIQIQELTKWISWDLMQQLLPSTITFN